VFILAIDVLVLNHSLDWIKLWGIPLILGPTLWLMARRLKTSTLVPDASSSEADTLAPAEAE